MTGERYVPAAGRAWLTVMYDPVMALTMREGAFRPALIEAVLAASKGPSPLVLDVGCGTGTLAAALARRDPTLELVGVDGDEEVLARARERATAFGARVRFLGGLADALPIADATVDVVVASLLLHHLAPEAKIRAMEEARRVLVPQGRLVIADWGPAHDPLMRAAFYVLQLLDGFQNTRDHVAGRLPSLLAQAGFDSAKAQQRWRTMWGSLEIITAETNAAREPSVAPP